MMRSTKALACLAVLVCVSAAAAQVMMPLPAYGSTYSGSVRGYWMEAPTDFTIVGLRVPDESGIGRQSVEVIKFDNNQPPPAYPNFTNAFVSLARFVDQPSANILPVNIPVSTGDILGLYGQCDRACSYGDPRGPFQSEIFGMPTTLTRSGMQYTLNSGPMHDVWQEPAGNVSRVELYYVPEPATFGLLALGALVLLRRR